MCTDAKLDETAAWEMLLRVLTVKFNGVELRFPNRFAKILIGGNRGRRAGGLSGAPIKSPGGFDEI